MLFEDSHRIVVLMVEREPLGGEETLGAINFPNPKNWEPETGTGNYLTSSRNAASSRMVIPNSRALAYLLPGSVPDTT